MRAVVVGVTSAVNRGVEALAVSHAVQLRERGFEVEVMTSDPSNADNIRAAGATVSREWYGGFRSRLRGWLPASLGGRRRAMRDFVRTLRTADLVVVTGGDILSFHYGNALPKLFGARTAIRSGRPTVFSAHSLGPFRTARERAEVAAVLKDASLVTVREPESYSVAMDELGLSRDRVALVADAAFLLEAVPAQESWDRVVSLGGRNGVPTVAVAVSESMPRFLGIDGTAHLAAWRETLTFIVDHLGAQVLMIPHVQGRAGRNDDVGLARFLREEVSRGNRVLVADRRFSSSDYKGLVGISDLVLAERMHVAIAGLSTGRATIAIAYSRKARGIMTDPVWSWPPGFDPVIEFPTFASSGNRLIEAAWKGREHVSAAAARACTTVKARAAMNFELLAEAAARSGSGG